MLRNCITEKPAQLPFGSVQVSFHIADLPSIKDITLFPAGICCSVLGLCIQWDGDEALFGQNVMFLKTAAAQQFLCFGEEEIHLRPAMAVRGNDCAEAQPL